MSKYQTIVNILCGAVVVVFGLSYLGVLNIHLFRGRERDLGSDDLGFFSAFLFGLIFSLGWTPCVGAFLGSALMLASQQGSMVQGILMLLCYSVGLGLPFLISAVLIDQLKGAFNWVKAHYDIINKVCGVLLILVGIAMATGTLGRLLSTLS